MHGGVHPATFTWLWRAILDDGLQNWYMHPHPGEALVHRARAQIATAFLDLKDADVLVMVDHDISAQPGDLRSVVDNARETKGIVGALVAKRAKGQGYGSNIPVGSGFEIGVPGLIEMPAPHNWMGGAFIAIHREALETIVKDMPRTLHGYYPVFQPFLKEIDGADGLMDISEDYALCEHAWKHNVPCHIDTKPFVAHHGHAHAYTVIDANPEVNEAANADA